MSRDDKTPLYDVRYVGYEKHVLMRRYGDELVDIATFRSGYDARRCAAMLIVADEAERA